MDGKIQQRVCIDFCFRLGKTGSETLEMLQTAFGESCLSRSKTFEWYSRFKSGLRSFEDGPRQGRPSTSHTDEFVARVQEMIRADRRLTIREVADDIGISIGTCHKIVNEDLHMRRVSAKLVPRHLTEDQKDDRLSICTNLLEIAKNDANFMSSIITGDESWVYGYDPETKQMSSQWQTQSSPRPKKARQVKSNVKTMLIAFFDIDGLVHHEYVPIGQSVNAEFYKTVLQRLRDAVRRHRPGKWRTGYWLIHHDNAPAHRSVTTNAFLTKHNIPLLPHPPYSPDLAPCDFFLFPQLKKTMKGRRFDDIEQIQANATRQMRAIPQSDYQRCFLQWQERWNKCVHSQGNYFEGDRTN
jgi:histone-lysine N-methyltransferase SETMAR